MNTNKTLDILKTAILLERRGKAFYEQVAAGTKDENTKKFFGLMAEEEQSHVEFLSRQYNSISKGGKFEKPVPNGSEQEPEQVLTDAIKKNISAAGFEAAAISAAIDMETRAIEIYSKRAAETTDPHEKEMYLFLAEWEKGHHKILHELDEELKEKIWFDNQFWPF
ncbi:MAG: ferritin family protein [Lentimicrobiaceae bacterium]|nr:ferritin family protein [Lentimicrobiaceae bacterium]